MNAARRAVTRWALRLFRREWRQQVLVLGLMTVAVTATIVGLAVATNATPHDATTLTIVAPDPMLAADVATIEHAFGPAPAFAHRDVPVPGSAASVDMRAQVSGTSRNTASMRLRQGRYPVGPDEVAMTRSAEEAFGVTIGDRWAGDREPARVVGVVENPLDLKEPFVLLAPGRLTSPATFTLVYPPGVFHALDLGLPSHSPLNVESASPGTQRAVAATILALATIGMLFVGLVAVAGFTVLAQRHRRALGMLGAVGATDSQVRGVMLANGAAVGLAADAVGGGLGLAGWLVFAPHLENLAGHRIDRFNLPWWALGVALVLTLVTALAAAWWPARSAANMAIVAALSERPPPPQPARRFALLGAACLAFGVALLAMASDHNALVIVGGTVATTFGVLSLAPLAIRALAVVGRRAPVAVRLALRDLVRYQARSGAALGAATLVIGIAATIVVAAAANENSGAARGRHALPRNHVIVFASATAKDGPVPLLTAEQRTRAETQIRAIAAAVGTNDVIPLEAAVSPSEPLVPTRGPSLPGGEVAKEPASLVQVTANGQGYDEVLASHLAIATPALLREDGIDPQRVDPTADVVTARSDLGGLALGVGRSLVTHPRIQVLRFTRHTSEPDALITPRAVQQLGLTVVTAEWLIVAPHPVSGPQFAAARKLAAPVGLAVLTPQPSKSNRLAKEATLGGIVLALGVLAMTVGLIRSETTGELRTLTATGASRLVRRTLTGTSAGALALLGAVLGLTGTYVALVAWNRHDLASLGRPPIANLMILLIGLPVLATGTGWLVAGREPAVIARRVID